MGVEKKKGMGPVTRTKAPVVSPLPGAKGDKVCHSHRTEFQDAVGTTFHSATRCFPPLARQENEIWGNEVRADLRIKENKKY